MPGFGMGCHCIGEARSQKKPVQTISDFIKLTKFASRYLRTLLFMISMLLGPANFSAKHPKMVAMLRCLAGCISASVANSSLRLYVEHSFSTVSCKI